MAKRPDYYLTVVRRVPRPIGGFENVYVISRRGWSKINYYRTHAAVPAKQAGKTLWDSMWNAGFLLYGTGQASEAMTSCMSKWLGRDLMLPLSDDLGQMLVILDTERGLAEMALTGLGNSSPAETLRTIDRAIYLQKRGLIPESVKDISFYVLNNRIRGISDQTSLITLLIRGGIELLTELTELKAKSVPIEANQTVTPKKDDSLLVDEKKRNEQLEKENASLRKELSDGRLERFMLRLRNGNLCNHIVNVSKHLTALSEDMEKIENPSFDAMAVKAIVYGKLIEIATMNYLTWNSNNTDA